MIKITHYDHMNNTTTTIECENINTLKEIGLIRVSPKMSASAESVYFGQFRRSIDLRICDQYVHCWQCPQYKPCHYIED